MKKLAKNLIIFLLSFTIISCGSEEEEDCDSLYTDGEYQKIIDRGDCDNWMEGAAYLGLAGFSFFAFADESKETLTDQLGLNASNVREISGVFDDENNLVTKGYYQLAREKVENSYLNSDDREKTLFIMGTFLSLFGEMVNLMDNGAGGSTAVDGDISDEESESFVGLTLDGSSDIEAEQQDLYQVKVGSDFFIMDDIEDPVTSSYFADSEADGVADNATNLGLPAGVTSASDFDQINQIVHVDKIDNPLSGDTSDGDASAAPVLTFFERIDGYLEDLTTAFTVGFDLPEDSEGVEELNEIKLKIDNGGLNCETISSSSLGATELLITNTAENALSDYSETNLFTIDELNSLGLDTVSANSSDVPEGSDFKVRMLFFNGAAYDPFWRNGYADIEDGMDFIQSFGAGDVSADDGEITLTEIFCAVDQF